MAKIFHIGQKPFDKELFEKEEEAYKSELKQNQCSHNNFSFYEDDGEVKCDDCGKEYTTQSFLSFWGRNKTPLSLESYNLRNTIHFLKKQKEELEDEVKCLKSEKRKLKKEITIKKIGE
ncbi:hypothetical protein D1Z98_01855 [Riemerella anatipestifer]|uniref:hypothetical protein n=1 Tax=Riemerella anatipestifer TaxID=34085 RepID=UPI00129D31A9|nr:hypothetical protein [Riemerella anatipestifer]MRM93754.1 hypothetical protein [Riemerella anatipestifer]